MFKEQMEEQMIAKFDLDEGNFYSQFFGNKEMAVKIGVSIAFIADGYVDSVSDTEKPGSYEILFNTTSDSAEEFEQDSEAFNERVLSLESRIAFGVTNFSLRTSV